MGGGGDLALCQSHFTLPLPLALLPSALVPKHSTHLFVDLPCARHRAKPWGHTDEPNRQRPGGSIEFILRAWRVQAF